MMFFGSNYLLHISTAGLREFMSLHLHEGEIRTISVSKESKLFPGGEPFTTDDGRSFGCEPENALGEGVYVVTFVQDATYIDDIWHGDQLIEKGKFICAIWDVRRLPDPACE